MKTWLKYTAVVAFTGFASAGLAQDVTLTAKDGTRSVSGKLVAAQPGKFIIRSNIGVLSLDADAFDCQGTACPKVLPTNTDLVVAGAAGLADILLPLVVEGFAAEQELLSDVFDLQGSPLGEQSEFSSLSDRGNATDEPSAFDILITDEDANPVHNVLVKEASGQGLFDTLISQAGDLIISEEPVTAENYAQARKNGLGELTAFEQEHVLAVDGYTATVNPKNTLGTLTIDQISQVMSGEIDNWQDLGGPDHKINVYTLPEASEAFHRIDALILSPQGRQAHSDTKTVRSVRALSRAIETDPYGFGVMRFSNIRDARPVPLRSECGIVHLPNQFAMKTEEYGLQNRVTAYNRRDLNGLSASFVSFLDSPKIDGLVSKSGITSLSVIEQDEAEKYHQLQVDIETMTDSANATEVRSFVADRLTTTRLSTTFRFAPGSANLDNKAKRDIARIADYIADVKPDRIVLAGFADAGGSFGTNRSLSLTRAKKVLRELRNNVDQNGAESTAIEVRGYGEMAPVACNTNPAGRAKNRRVEVWSEIRRSNADGLAWEG
jgi:phosphate transport system substrate-binding protein